MEPAQAFEEVHKFLGHQNPKSALIVLDMILSESPSDEDYAHALALKLVCYKNLSMLEDGVRVGEEALEKFKELGDAPHQADIARDIGLLHEYAGKHKEALTWLDRSVSILQSVDDKGRLGVGLAKKAQVLLFMQRLSDAEKSSAEGLKLAREASHPFYELTALIPAVWLSLFKGELNTSEKLLEDSSELILKLETEEGHRNERRAAEFTALWAHYFRAVSNHHDAFTSFASFLKVMLLVEEMERRRILFSMAAGRLYESFGSGPMNENLKIFLIELERGHPDLIDWTQDSIQKELGEIEDWTEELWS